MAPNTTLSFAIAKRICTAAELERLACAFLNHEDFMKFDADAAAAQMGTGVKPESFKRVLQNTIKKIREATANPPPEVENEGEDSAPKTTKGKPGRKRKTPASEEGEGKETNNPTSKKAKSSKRTKKASLVETEKAQTASEGEVNGWMAVNGSESESSTPVKAEEGDE